MKNKKLILLLATTLVLGACGKETATPKDKAQEEKPAVEEKAKDGVKEVANDDKKSNDDKDEEALDLSKIIKAEDAMKKALEGQKEDAWVVEYELEIDDGKAIYDIDVENGQDIKIDAVTGEIIERD